MQRISSPVTKCNANDWAATDPSGRHVGLTSAVRNVEPWSNEYVTRTPETRSISAMTAALVCTDNGLLKSSSRERDHD